MSATLGPFLPHPHCVQTVHNGRTFSAFLIPPLSPAFILKLFPILPWSTIHRFPKSSVQLHFPGTRVQCSELQLQVGVHTFNFVENFWPSGHHFSVQWFLPTWTECEHSKKLCWQSSFFKFGRGRTSNLVQISIWNWQNISKGLKRFFYLSEFYLHLSIIEHVFTTVSFRLGRIDVDRSCMASKFRVGKRPSKAWKKECKS